MKKVARVVVGSLSVAAVCTAGSLVAKADNPIIQSYYTADPSPMVDGDTLYLYTSHDSDGPNSFYDMKDYKCFSTTDMVNWTYEGTPAGIETFSAWSDLGSDGAAWAQQVVERNGKYYMYAPIRIKGGAWGIGVAVSDSPTGPFKDALGTYLIDAGWEGIDPTVFIDDDGQAYLYWGNPNLHCAKLNEDMISYDKSFGDDGIMTMDMTDEAFGDGGDKDGAAYQEGPWFYKRDGIYYMVYPAIVGNGGEFMAYSTSTGPIGPWKYQGPIMDTDGLNSYTIHPGVADYKGHSYLFYHNGNLPGGGSFTRSVAVDEFVYGEDGKIPFIKRTSEGVHAVQNLDPFQKNEAETIAWEEGVRPVEESDGKIAVRQIHNNDYIKVKDADFGEGASTFTANVSCLAGGAIELRVDSKDGPVIGTLNVTSTGGTDQWREQTTGVQNISGVHDLYMLFKGDTDQELFAADTWQFGKAADAQTVTALNVTADTYELDITDGIDTATLNITAVFGDGSVKDVSQEAELSTEDTDIVNISGNQITGIGYGDAVVQISYGGAETEFKISVKDLSDKLSVQSVEADKNIIDGLVGQQEKITITATYSDGHTEDVTMQSEYMPDDPQVAQFEDGKIIIKGTGSTSITVTYYDRLGNAKSTVIEVTGAYKDPYQKVEAEDYNEQCGTINLEDCQDEGGTKNLANITEGAWVKYNGVNFDHGTSKFIARIATVWGFPKYIEIRLDSPDSEAAARVQIDEGTGDWQKYQTFEWDIPNLYGCHDVYLVFPENESEYHTRDINFNWWQFVQDDSMDYDQIRDVRETIAGIGTVEYTDESRQKIEAARAAYDQLTEEQKQLVDNYNVLEEAEARYAELEMAAKNEAAAANVEKVIGEIGTVEYTDASRQKIEAARAAYDQLTEEQKQLVDNYNVLEEAEKKYAAMKEEAEQKEEQQKPSQPSDETQTKVPEQNVKGKAVRTGDEQSLAGMAVLSGISALALIGAIWRKKK